MEEKEWKEIINELSQQIATISIERAVARAQVSNLVDVIDNLQKQIRELSNGAITDDSIIQTVTKE